MIFVLVLFLLIISSASTAGLYFSLKKNLELISTLEYTMSEIENSIEILNYYYKRIDKKSKMELLSDDATIRELVEDMKQARRAVLLVSEKLTGEKEDIEGQDLA